MAASISGVLTLLIVIIVAPLTAYLYNRCGCHKWCSSRWNASKKRMSETALGRQFSMEGIRRRLSRFSTRRQSSSGDDAANMTESMLLRHQEQFDDTRSNSAVLFGLIGMAVGVGNIYRFPFVISANGGGTALIIYIICLSLVAYPLFFYEMIIGYYIRKPPIQAFKIIHPRWSTVPIAQFLMLILNMSYFSVITAHCLTFIVGSCMNPMPWTAEAQGTETNAEASQKFWYEDVLRKYTDEEMIARTTGEMGGMNPYTVGSSLVTWFLIFMSMAFGQKLVHKITRITVIAPIVIMIVMVIAANTLPGSSDGIAFYIGKFDASKFGELTVWATCLAQVIFSLGPGFGIGIAYAATLEDPQVNIAKMCATVASVNALFSIFGGFYTFAVVGNVAYTTGEAIQDITDKAGQGLAFVVAPVAMMNFGSAANVMSVLFFLMMFTLGIDTCFAFVESMVAFIDGCAHIYKKERYLNRKVVMLITCIALFLTTLPYTTRLGVYILDVIDFFTQTIGLLFSCFVVMLAISFDFKYIRVNQTMEGTGHNLQSWYGKPTFYFLAPISSLFLAMYLLINTIIEPFPSWEEAGVLDSVSALIAVGWFLFALLMTFFVASLWRRGPSSLPPTIPEPKDGEEEMKKVQDDVDFEDEEPNDDAVELAEQADIAEDTPSADEESRVEKAVDVEA